MKAEEIGRVEVGQEVETACSDIREQAYKVLGYGPGRLGPGVLAKALQELEIRPLDPQQAIDYMASKDSKKFTWASLRYFLGALACLPVVYFMGGGVLREEASHDQSASFLVFMGMFLLTMGSAITFCACISSVFSSRESWHWDTADVDEYDGEIPDFALDRALKVHAEVPDVQLEVHYLTSEAQRDPDPFLCASYRDELFFLDAWEEEIES